MCFLGIFLQTVRAHPVTNLPLHINRWCISRQAAVNLCFSSALVFFERSLGRAAARRSSPGSQHRPGFPPSPFLQLPHRQFQAIIGFIAYVFLFGASSFSLSDFFPPSTNTWMRWKLDIISRHWLQRNFLLGGINRNVITRPLKHSTSAEINTAELRGLKHWIVKVD